jgi:hypothetical protein
MPDVDVTLELAKVIDEVTPKRDGTFDRNRVYTFYLGKWGPFVEKVPTQPTFDDGEFMRRVQRMQQHLRQVHV